jgi:hypothetical protein
LKLLGVGGNANAVAHRVAFFQTLQLANAARCVLDPTRSAKFMMACCCLSPPSGIGICSSRLAVGYWRLQSSSANKIGGRPVAAATTVRRVFGVEGIGDWLRATVTQLRTF